MKTRIALVLAVVLLATSAVAALENLALGRSYWIEIMDPNDGFIATQATYPDIDDRQLTDGKRDADNRYNKPEWVGFLRQDSRIIEIDLGKAYDVKKIVVSTLQSKDVGISAPEYIEVRVSADGNSWSQDFWEPNEQTTVHIGNIEFVFDIGMKARFIEIFIPVNVWVFVDEVEVWGTR